MAFGCCIQIKNSSKYLKWKIDFFFNLNNLEQMSDRPTPSDRPKDTVDGSE